MKLNIFNHPPKKEDSSETEKSISKKHGFFSKKGLVLGATLAASIPAVASSAEHSFADTTDRRKSENLIKEGPNKVEINIATYFKTDSAEVPMGDEEYINKLVGQYMLNLNSQNVDRFLNSHAKLKVSCDPRKTNLYKNGNKELAERRAAETQKFVTQEAEYFDFSKTDLTSEQAARVVEKLRHLEVDIPLTKDETGQGENGVIDYHKVINPETGKTYTDADWTELHKPGNEKKKEEAYKNFRYVTLEFEAIQTPPQPEKTPGLTIETKGIQKVLVFFDDSPSMKAHKGALAEALKNNGSEIPVEIFGFTNKIDQNFSAANLTEAAKKLEEIKLVEQKEELAVDVVLGKLRTLEAKEGENILILVSTDELLQKVSSDKLSELKKLLEEKHATIQYTLMLNGKMSTPGLEDIKKAYDEKFENEVRGFQKIIDNRKNTIQKLKEQLVGTTGKQKKDIEKLIKEAQAQIEDYQNQINAHREVDLGNFENIQHIGQDYTGNPNNATIPGAYYSKGDK